MDIHITVEVFLYDLLIKHYITNKRANLQKIIK